MPASLRAFIAAELPGDLTAALGRIQRELAGAGVRARWVRPESIHLTLKFLGRLPVEGVARVAEALAASVEGQPAFRLTAGGLGVFPGLRRPRVVWVGLGGETEALTGLQQRVDRNLAARGFAPEARPFRAHLTLGRFDDTGSPGPVADVLARDAGREAGRFEVRELVLFKSDLRPTGAVYSALVRAGLGAAPFAAPE